MEGCRSNAAFVIHLRDSTDVAAGRVEGKVEHIASYRATRFRSVDELLEFMALVLAENRKRGRGR